MLRMRIIQFLEDHGVAIAVVLAVLSLAEIAYLVTWSLR